MRYLATYLIYLAVLVRAVGWHQESGPLGTPIWVLLGVFGCLLFVEQAVTRKLAWFPRLYTAAQSILVIVMMYRAPTVDFLSLLFLPLSFQAVWFFQRKIGYLTIAAYSLSIIGLLFLDLEWEVGLTMILATTGADFLIGTFASLIADTEKARVKNQRLYLVLKESYQQLKHSANLAKTTATADMRRRLLRDLHDSLAQILFSMNLAAQAAQLTLLDDPQRADSHLLRLEDLTRRAADEVDRLMHQHQCDGQAQVVAESSQGIRRSEHLLMALEKLADERARQDGLTVELQITGDRTLSAVTQATLYRIVQESLNNIIRHAGVHKAVVSLDLNPVSARLSIADAGRGFNTDDPGTVHGFGLTSMAGQAWEIGWLFEVSSQPGCGTQVLVREVAP